MRRREKKSKIGKQEKKIVKIMERDYGSPISIASSVDSSLEFY